VLLLYTWTPPVCPVQVLHQALALRQHCLQAALAAKVLAVVLHVQRQLLYARAQAGNLHCCAAHIAAVLRKGCHLAEVNVLLVLVGGTAGKAAAQRCGKHIEASRHSVVAGTLAVLFTTQLGSETVQCLCELTEGHHHHHLIHGAA
jgi:hypothetical protein